MFMLRLNDKCWMFIELVD